MRPYHLAGITLCGIACGYLAGVGCNSNTKPASGPVAKMVPPAEIEIGASMPLRQIPDGFWRAVQLEELKLSEIAEIATVIPGLNDREFLAVLSDRRLGIIRNSAVGILFAERMIEMAKEQRRGAILKLEYGSNADILRMLGLSSPEDTAQDSAALPASARMATEVYLYVNEVCRRLAPQKPEDTVRLVLQMKPPRRSAGIAGAIRGLCEASQFDQVMHLLKNFSASDERELANYDGEVLNAIPLEVLIKGIEDLQGSVKPGVVARWAAAQPSIAWTWVNRNGRARDPKELRSFVDGLGQIRELGMANEALSGVVDTITAPALGSLKQAMTSQIAMSLAGVDGARFAEVFDQMPEGSWKSRVQGVAGGELVWRRMDDAVALLKARDAGDPLRHKLLETFIQLRPEQIPVVQPLLRPEEQEWVAEKLHSRREAAQSRE